MSPRWRKGISGATQLERLALLECERSAGQIALATKCSEWCDESDLGLVDCGSLQVLRSRVRWFRSEGRVFVVVAVDLNTDGAVYQYRWKLSQDDLRRLANLGGNHLTP